ncbi:heterokaryon incompatibility protein-domain-containing protein [Cercophora newfieldiana]|uniref:Heterokaryon incompatibility protein-domain-containing protein n=1 Tax=Cercophora newfieldiana TaxID=92897 RepID=A0AA39YEN8_9PEZI|nr:heterokaryon incompatibility protein-domain-containing protein [Cercophora newfieldiana]
MPKHASDRATLVTKQKRLIVEDRANSPEPAEQILRRSKRLKGAAEPTTVSRAPTTNNSSGTQSNVEKTTSAVPSSIGAEGKRPTSQIHVPPGNTSQKPSVPPRPRHWFTDFVPAQGHELGSSEWAGTVPLSVLCNACERVSTWMTEHRGQKTRSKITTWLEHHESGQDLERSMLAGCHLCTLIWHHFTDEPLWEESDSDTDSLDLKQKRDDRVSRLLAAGQIKVGFGAPKIPYDGLDIFGLDATTQSGAKQMLAHSIEFREESSLESQRRWKNSWYDLKRQVATVHTSAKSHIPLLRQWIDDCEENHETCRALLNSKLPHRLLELEGTDAGERIRLVSAEALGASRPQYVALSYCWGSSDCFKLTSETESALRVGVSVSGLPPTIQHAISVSRNLGFRYIWVDSLCIIQDSPEDWAKESATMCDVYQGSHVCVASLVSTSSDQGMFAIRDPLLHTPLVLGSGKNVPTFVSVHSILAWHAPTWPLHKRAWVTQERILAPRTIGFGQYLTWECREASRSEARLDSEALPNDASASPTSCGRFFQQVLWADQNMSTSAENPNNAHYRWRSLLGEYSGCSMTHGSDRLAALLGIASAIQRKTGWGFLAGLWLPFFVRDMLWMTYEGSAGEGVGPSWSWTSTLGKVYLCYDDYSALKEHAKVDIPAASREMAPSGATLNKRLPVAIHVTCIALEVDPVSGIRVACIQNGRQSNGDLSNDIRYDRGRSEKTVPKYLLLMAEAPEDYYDTAYFIVIADSTVLGGAFERIGYCDVSMWRDEPGAVEKALKPPRGAYYPFRMISRKWLDEKIATGERRTFTLV